MRVEGFVLKPEYAKKTREQFFFVNDRFGENAHLHNAIREVFEEVSAEHHPGYFLFLRLIQIV